MKLLYEPLKKLSLLLFLAMLSIQSQATTICLLNQAERIDTADNRYIIKAGSFKSKSNALRYQAHLQQLTHYPVNIRDERYYRVLIGPIPSARETRKAARAILNAPKQTMSFQDLLFYDDRHWYATLGLGPQWTQTKSSMTVPNGSDYPSPENVDLFSVSRPEANGMFFLSAGHRWERDTDWLSAFSLGLYYQYLFNRDLSGTITQYSEPQFLNYTYQWGTSSNLVMALGKVNIYQWQQWSPYVSLGLGVAINQTNSYTEEAYPNVTARFSPAYSGGSSANFAYQLGIGFDYQVASAWILSLGYLYQNMGPIVSGPGQSTWSQTHLNLGSSSQSEIAFSVTYLI